jgi:hypothetical protein
MRNEVVVLVTLHHRIEHDNVLPPEEYLYSILSDEFCSSRRIVSMDLHQNLERVLPEKRFDEKKR